MDTASVLHAVAGTIGHSLGHLVDTQVVVVDICG